VTDDAQTPATIAEYRYDGLGRRIVKVDDAAEGDPRYHYYYDRGQVVEERKELSGTEDTYPLAQYVWHPYYIDALALRWYDPDTDGQSVAAHYYTHDANFNVTAVMNDSGAVLERYHYSPYGAVTILNGVNDNDGAEWSEDTNGSDIANPYLYTGRRLDAETGLYYNFARYYHAQLGRFINRDPIGYGGGDANLYRYVGNTPTNAVDPLGLWKRIKGTKARWVAEKDGETLEELAQQVSGDRSDWVCIWVLANGARKEKWVDYPVARAGAQADVSNLLARTGPSLAMTGPPGKDPYMKALNKVLSEEKLNAGFNDVYHWKTGSQAGEKIRDAANYGATPISRLIVGGHHYHSPGEVGTIYGRERPTDDHEAGFSANDVLAAAPPDLRDNTKNTLERASKQQGPPKCWFTKNAVIWGVSCNTGVPMTHSEDCDVTEETSWVQQWADSVARQGVQVRGTPSLLETDWKIQGDGFGRQNEWGFLGFVNEGVSSIARNMVEFVNLGGWVQRSGTQ